MAYFTLREARRTSPAVLRQGLHAMAAWVIALSFLALVVLVFSGGRFLVGWHSAAAAGPALALMSDDFLDGGALTVWLYLVSLGAALAFQSRKFSWLWLILWFGCGGLIFFFKLARHFST